MTNITATYKTHTITITAKQLDEEVDRVIASRISISSDWEKQDAKPYLRMPRAGADFTMNRFQRMALFPKVFERLNERRDNAIAANKCGDAATDRAETLALSMHDDWD